MEKDSAIEWLQASGGGYGDPYERDPEAVLSDVKDEHVTIEQAREHYGIVIEPETMRVDESSSAVLRAARTAR